MTISNIFLPSIAITEKRLTGSFTTDGAGDLATTTVGSTGISAGVMNVTSSAGFLDDIVTVAGAGLAGVAKAIPVAGTNLLAANQFTLPNPGIEATVTAGSAVTKWNKIPFEGLPKRIIAVRRDNGDKLEWVEGMEPLSLKVTTGAGVYSLNTTLAAYVTAGAISYGPGILANSVTYDLEILL